MVTAHTRHMSRGSNKTSKKYRENRVEAPGIEFAEKNQENLGVSRRLPVWRVHPGRPLRINESQQLQASAAGLGTLREQRFGARQSPGGGQTDLSLLPRNGQMAAP